MKKRFIAIGLATLLILFLTACGNSSKSDTTDNQTQEVAETSTVSESDSDSFSLTPSPDKYTQYVDKYVGMNAASVGYTSWGGDRLIRIGEGLLTVTFVTADGTYVGPDDKDDLKNYVVVSQSIEPNTEVKLEFEKDSSGEEYDTLVAYQSYEKIDLLVKKIGDADPNIKLAKIDPSPDKYTHHIQNYIGKNVNSIGYTSLGGDYLDAYGDGYLKLNLAAEDGSYIDISDKSILKQYVVTNQSIAANSEMKYTYSVDSKGNEYSNLVNSQTYNSITLNVKSVSGEPVISTKESASENKDTEPQVSVDNDEDSSPVFEPQDVSDAAIESIKTYGDYLVMYRAIIDDYLAKYEKVVKGTILDDENDFKEFKDDLDEAYEDAEKEYGSMKNKKIVGKEVLVEYLKNVRDSLQIIIDSYEEVLDAFQ
ncbi:MAG: hypothetical protein IJG50_07165 [Clostridia bacterium]|nr:hypothetical protein [Clostridia bacterium]